MELPLGIITGTGVVKGWMATTAYSAYTGHTQHRVFGIHGQGLGRLEEGYARTSSELETWARDLPSKVVLMGHSQGALHAWRFALEHPELVDHVVLLCGPLDGTKMVSLIPRWLRPAVAMLLPAIDDMDWDSPYVRQLKWRVANGWPTEVKVTMVSVHGDVYVRPRRSAWALELPCGSHVRRFYLGLLRPRDLPEDVRFVLAPAAGHLTVLVHPIALDIVRRRLSAPSSPQPVAA